MSKVLVTAERNVEISHHQFVVQDFEWDEHANPPLTTDGSLGVGESSVRVLSLVHTHAAEVAVEVWDGEPDPAKVPVVGEATILSRSGVLLIDQLFDGFAGGPVALGMPGLYRVQVCRELAYPAEGIQDVAQGGVYEGLERYVIRFWQTGPLPDGQDFEDRLTG